MKHLYLIFLLLASAKSNGQLTLKPIALPSIDFVSDVTAICKNQGSGCGVLPVALLTFTGNRLNNAQVGLNWTTANEFNNRGFNVERSLGDAGSFYKVGFVGADAGTAAKKQYRFTDANSYPDISYYRLKQFDLDSNFTFSDVIAIHGYDGAESMSLSPNPASSYIVVHIFSTVEEVATVALLGLENRTIANKTIALTKGNNEMKFQVDALADGLYIIQQTRASGMRFSAKFLKE